MPATLPSSSEVAPSPVASTGSLLGAAPTPAPTERSVFNLPPAPLFTFLCSPESWDVFETPDGTFEILPILQRLAHEPGVKGVRDLKLADGRHVGDPEIAKDRLRRKGWIPVPADFAVELYDRDGTLVHRQSGYVHVVEGKRGAVHLDVWTRPYKLGASVHLESDRRGYIVFLRAVRDQLLGGQADPAIRSALQVKLAGLARMGAEKAAHSPSAARLADQVGAKLVAFQPKPAEPAKGKRA